MTGIDAATRMAYVDGELDEIARRRVEQAIAEDPELAEMVARDRALREQLRGRFAVYAAMPAPHRFRVLLDTNVLPIVAGRRQNLWRPSMRRWAQGIAIAATLILAVAVDRQIASTGPVTSRNGILVAHGQLEVALDKQLASTQPNDVPIRIGLTFRDHSGSICRTFNGDILQGIACRGNGRWQLTRTATGEREGRYRQAASGAMIDEAQQMMVGRPLSAPEEAAAMRRDWE